MPSVVDVLEQSVGAAVDLIADLRSRVITLEKQLEDAQAEASVRPSPPAAGALREERAELERLRRERVAIREQVSGILRELDRVLR